MCEFKYILYIHISMLIRVYFINNRGLSELSPEGERGVPVTIMMSC